MKKLFTILFCSFALASTAQDFAWSNSPVDTAFGSASDFEIISTSYFINNGTDSTFVWQRISNIPSGWDNTVCDINQCYGENVDSAQFILAKGDSFNMKANFYANDIDGFGCIILHIISLTNRNDTVTKQFCATTALSTGPSTLLNQLTLFPNPASNDLHVELKDGGLFDLQIVDLTGRVLLSQTDNNGNEVIDISNLKKGVYSVQVVSNGISATKSFIKTH